MDASVQREDQNGQSSVANIRRNREERERDQAERARLQRGAGALFGSLQRADARSNTRGVQAGGTHYSTFTAGG